MFFYVGMLNFSKFDDRCIDYLFLKFVIFIEMRRNLFFGYRKELYDGGDVGL